VNDTIKRQLHVARLAKARAGADKATADAAAAAERAARDGCHAMLHRFGFVADVNKPLTADAMKAFICAQRPARQRTESQRNWQSRRVAGEHATSACVAKRRLPTRERREARLSSVRQTVRCQRA
jgi:hypothetical protein